MTEQEQRYAYKFIAQMLAERVVEKLLERQKQALVVYTGSNMGIEPGLACLRTLRQKEGFTYRVLLTRSAAGLLDVSAIRSALEPEEFWVETPGYSPEVLTARYDTILVPALTVNTAAHVAACMADTPAAAVILDGLMRGKNVVAAVDGCCPDNPQRLQRGFHMTEALKQKLRENKEALKGYGAWLTTSDKLGETALKAITSFSKPVASNTKALDANAFDANAAGATGSNKGKTESLKHPETGAAGFKQRSQAQGEGVYHAKLEGRVFSGMHIKSYPDHATIYVPKRTIVTQLVSDEARRRDIRIEFEP